MNTPSIPPARLHGARLVSVFAALLALGKPAIAANIWDGGGADGKWSTLANWDDNALPTFGTGITFAGTTNLLTTNDIANATVGGLTFDGTADAFTIGGNALTLTGPITDNSLAPQTINAPLVLGAAVTANVAANGSLTIGPGAGGTGVISGTFGLTKAGNGTVTLGAVNTYTGDTFLDGGTLRFTASNAGVKNLTFGAVLNSANVSSLVLEDADVTATGLTFQTNINVPNTVSISAGRTLRINGAMAVGPNVAGLNIGGVATQAAFSGAGTLFVNAGTNHLQVALPRTNNDTGGDPQATLDLTGLSNFTFTATTGEVRVGGGNAAGNLRLANTLNIIAAAQIRVGDSGVQGPGGGNNIGGTSNLTLGPGLNAFNTNTIVVGAAKAPGNLTFQAGTGTLSIAGLAGGTTRANITVGNASSATATNTTSTVQLAGHDVNVLANTVMLGQLAGSSGGAGLGSLTFDTGLFDVNNLMLGTHTSGTAPNGTTGTFTLGGAFPNNTSTAVLNVNSQFLLVNRTLAAGTAANATFVVNGGTANVNANIVTVDASTSPTATRTTTLTLAGGTLNMMGHSIGTAALPITNVNLPIVGQTATLSNLGGAGINEAGLNFASGGTLILDGTNTYTGTTTISGGGTLRVGTGGASGTFGAGPIVNDGNIVIDRTGTLNIAGGISGSGTILKLGDGAAVIAGPNNNTGQILVEQGSLAMTGTVGALSISSNGSVRTGFGGPSGTLTVASLGVTGGNLQFDFEATGPLINVTGAATFSGATTITPNISVNTGTYTLLTAGTLTLTPAPILVAPTGTRKSFTADYSTANTIKLIVAGASKSLNWTGTVNGTWDFDAGATQNWADVALLPEKFFQGDTVAFRDGPANRNVTIASGEVRPAAVLVDNALANPYTIGGAGAIGGPGALVKNGDGTVSLGTANTFTGGVTLNAGRLNIHHATALGTGTLTITGGSLGNASGASVSMTANNPQVWNGNFTFEGPDPLNVGPGVVTLGADRTVTISASTFTVGGPIQGAFGLTKAGSGTLVLSGTSSHASTTVLEGAVQVGNAGTSGDLGAGPVSNSGTLRFNRTDNFTAASVISGAGDLIQVGSGILSLVGVNSYTGVTAIGAGKIRVSNSNSLGALSGNVFISQGGALDLGGSATAQALNFGAKQFSVTGTGPDGAGAIINTGVSQFNALQFVTLTGNTSFGGTARFDIRSVPTTQLNAKLDLAGFTLTKIGSNEFSLVGTDVTDGDIVVEQGLFSIETVTKIPDFGTGKKITLNAGTTLRFFGNTDPVSAVLRPIVFNGAGIQMGNNNNANSVIGSPMTLNGDIAVVTLNNNVANSLTLTGVIGETTPHSITKNGVGTLVLTGSNTYSGGLILNAGTLGVHNASALGTGPFTIGGGTISNTSGAPITLSANNAQNWNGDFTFAGPDPINLGTGGVTLTANRTLTVNAGELTVGGAITGGFGLTKSGSGRLILNGASSFTGVTTLSAGTLTVNGSLTGGVTANGGILEGLGPVGPVTLAGAALSPGNTVGILQTGDLQFNAGALFAELTGPVAGVGAGFYDQVSVTGTVAFNTSIELTLNFSAYDPVDGVDRFTLVSNDGNDAIAFADAFARFVYNGTPLNEGSLFEATSGANIQQFSITYAGGSSGNDIVLQAVPEPGAFMSVLGGLGALALTRFRRRSA